jgi:DNA-binding transcriptional ArsR family regulator
MPKLAMKSPPGFNANLEKNHEPKKVRLDKIVIDPDISKIFDIQVKIKDDVLKSILNRGYDPEQPIVLWEGHNILVDGRTRYTAALEAGLEEIFAYERYFPSREDAILYAFERQAVRRNLSAKEILKAAQMIPDVRRQKGQGRIAEEIAQTLKVSPSTIYQARKILKEASPEDIQSIENGETSFKAVSKKLSKNPEEEKPSLIQKPESKEVKIVIKWLTEELRLQSGYIEKRTEDEKELGYLYGLKRALCCLTDENRPSLHFTLQDMSEDEFVQYINQLGRNS